MKKSFKQMNPNYEYQKTIDRFEIPPNENPILILGMVDYKSWKTAVVYWIGRFNHSKQCFEILTKAPYKKHSWREVNDEDSMDRIRMTGWIEFPKELNTFSLMHNVTIKSEY
jgi:hypothetical protein